ncbi:hypothetical protein A4X13_0g8597 [Tilletia indica]|uniref:Uncharacterized protein n=1 Tax=Tilletia indica TaxID=43049 RepID=A0A8T8SDU3_9BASI|nr:hypothetical protein A4X13_0g8597 [Tilletia indica]
MFSFIKTKARMLGLAILAAQLLTIAVASPLDKAPGLLARDSLPHAPGQLCDHGDECLSGGCTDYSFATCTNTDGSFRLCDHPDYVSGFCDRYPLGHKCANNGECNEGLCKSGVCTAGKVGNKCFEQYQCAGLCSDNKCISIAAGSVHPTESCKANSDCISERFDIWEK